MFKNMGSVNVKSLCCTPETNTLYANSTLIKKKIKENLGSRAELPSLNPSPSI